MDMTASARSQMSYCINCALICNVIWEVCGARNGGIRTGGGVK